LAFTLSKYSFAPAAASLAEAAIGPVKPAVCPMRICECAAHSVDASKTARRLSFRNFKSILLRVKAFRELDIDPLRNRAAGYA
jgi:hypothetical protein